MFLNCLLFSIALMSLNSDIAKIKHGLEETGSPNISRSEELAKLKKINELFTNIEESLNVTETNIDKVDETLKITNELVDNWANILLKNGEISQLLSSENEKHKWNGSSADNDLIEKKTAKYNHLLSKYNQLKQEKTENEKKILEQQRIKEARVKQRQEVLQRRIYGNRRGRSAR